jgi:hypothetical protein
MTAKRKPSANREPRVKELEVEVVPELRPPGVVKDVALVERRLSDLDGMSEAKLLGEIKSYAGHAARHAQSAVQSAASAVVYAWGCGKLLEAAKARVGHGKFDKWREQNLGKEVMSQRTSQRYMKLAKDWENVEALLEWHPTLRQAYIASGVLPAPPDRQHPVDGDREAAKRQALLSSITGIQKRLRLFDGVKGELEADEKAQLKLAKAEIDEFFDRIFS